MNTPHPTRKASLLVAGLVVTVALALTAVLAARRTPGDSPNMASIMAAARAHLGSLKAEGRPVPDSVSVADLIARGHLTPAEAGLFANLEVTLHPTADPTHPGSPLAEVHLPDGQLVVALADGSVQVRRAAGR